MRVYLAAIAAVLASASLSLSNAQSPPAPAEAYSETGPLTLEEMISAGRRKFSEPWSLRNDLEGVWGLGPTFNEVSCAQCHPGNGRSAAPAHGMEATRGMIVRLSLPGTDAHGAPMPHPHYGDQLQNRGIAERVPKEGRALVFYESVPVAFADGEVTELRRPRIEFRDLRFGALEEDVMHSARNASALAGLGLLEAVPEETLLAIAREQPALGVSGRPNYVWDIEANTATLGRFGWKASQPSLRQQVAAAMLNDIGATSTLFPHDNCPSAQIACRTDSTTTDCGGACSGSFLPEALPSRLATITTFLQALTVPARESIASAQLQRGKELFEQNRCSACHVPELRTGAATIASLANVAVRAYTDLLLHDMGEGLADHRPDYLADGSEWRTAPLWGIGAAAGDGHMSLLHDGRARSVSEAILWHGGEAAFSSTAFRAMPKADRDALVRFVAAL